MTITPNTKVPLYVVGSAIGLAIYGTFLYVSLLHNVTGMLSISQAQQWLDDARDKNPGIVWPRIPTKESQANTDPVSITQRQP